MIQKLLDLIETALSWLPTSPIQDYAQTINNSTGLGWLNWFLPIGTMLELMSAWLAAIALYYLASIILRWVKAIQ